MNISMPLIIYIYRCIEYIYIINACIEYRTTMYTLYLITSTATGHFAIACSLCIHNIFSY